MNLVAIACSTVTAVALCAALFFEHRKTRAGVYVAKPLASMGFLGTAFANGVLDSSYGHAILTALVLSFFGDVFLMSKKTAFFRAGLVSFLLGHMAFAVAFLVLGSGLAAAAGSGIVMLLAAIVVGRWLVPHVERALRGPVIAYIAVISVMVTLAVSAGAATGRWGIAVAAIAFYGSDLSVARDRFLGAGFTNRMWGLPLYYAAQLAFAWQLP